MASLSEPTRPSTSSSNSLSVSLATTSSGQSVLVPFHSPAGTSTPGADYPNAIDPRILSSSDLATIREQLYSDEGSDSHSYAKRLVDHALAVEALRAAERPSSAELAFQPTAATATQLSLERTLVELEQVRTQARALARKLATKGPAPAKQPEEPKRMVWSGPTGGVYGSQGTAVYKYGGAFQTPATGETGESAFDVENRKLKSDVRHLKRKQLASDTQVSRMESELRQLRAHLLTGTPLIATDIEILIPSSSDPPSKPLKGPLMGDAEAEHLLLAGKALSHVRRINRVPLAKALEQQAPEIAAYAFAVPSTSSQLPTAAARKRPRARTPPLVDPPVPGPSSSSSHAAPPARARRASASTAANLLGGGAMDDLLQAAAILEPAPAQSTTKRRRTSRSISLTSDALPAEPEPFLSALDLLADQAFTASQRTAAITPWRLSSVFPSSTLVLSPPLSTPSPSLFADPFPLPPLPPIPNPRDPRLAPLVAPDDPRLQRRISPGLGEKEKGSGWEEEGEEGESVASAAKRLRSPYVKWNLTEDELLIKAVSAHGQRWDAVAAAVPTRSYHQCRQRFLRGLKSGDALPEELQSMASTVKKAVRDYEAGRARNKGKVMSASDEGGEYGEDEMGDEMGD